MSNAKFPDNPFAPSTALTAREGSNGLAHRSPASNLPAPKASPALNPFANPEPLQPGRSSIALDAFSASRPSLPCRDSGATADRSPAAYADVDLEIRCCGVPLELEIADMQAEGPDTLPGGQIAVVDRILHGSCKVCHREHHHSVGEVIRREEFR